MGKLSSETMSCRIYFAFFFNKNLDWQSVVFVKIIVAHKLTFNKNMHVRLKIVNIGTYFFHPKIILKVRIQKVFFLKKKVKMSSRRKLSNKIRVLVLSKNTLVAIFKICGGGQSCFLNKPITLVS